MSAGMMFLAPRRAAGSASGSARDHLAAGQHLAYVVEHDHPVAEQAPPWPGMRGGGGPFGLLAGTGAGVGTLRTSGMGLRIVLRRRYEPVLRPGITRKCPCR